MMRRHGLGAKALHVRAVMRERAVMRQIGEDSASGESFVP